jgi:hypothetical protein
MEQIIKIQEEFENLISELNNLRKVNQLTSENTQNATKVISEITSFVNSINSFKISVFKDYEAKKVDFENAIELLSSSFNNIDDNTSQQSKNLIKLLDDTKISVNQEVDDLKVKIKSTTDDYIDSLKSINTSIQKSIELFAQTTANSIEAREANLVSIIENIDQKTDILRHDFMQIKEENELAFSQISNSFEQKSRSFNSQLERGLESIKLNQAENVKTVEEKIEEQQKVICDLIFAEIKKNREEVRSSRISIIVLMIIIIGILIYVAIK